jgi:conjugative transfer signal peptidase TraF
MIEPRFTAGAAALGVLAIGLAATIAVPLRPLLVWNASASAPVGLYAVAVPDGLEAGDLVIARVPEHLRMLAARRRYLPANVPLVKRVAAEPGDRVCASGPAIFVNGRRIATRLAHDGIGRPMPWWSGCVTLRRGAMFLLMDDPKSFDGRYFGPTGPRDIIGKATLLWAR